MNKIIFGIGLSFLTFLCISSSWAMQEENTKEATTCSPKTYSESYFQEVEVAVKVRSEKFLTAKHFHSWSMDRPAVEILEEMNQLYKFREEVWYKDPKARSLEFKDEFMLPHELVSKGHKRNPKCLAFGFNNPDPNHNVSTVVVNGLKFLPSDAPSEDSIESYSDLLRKFGVTHLVRLTAATEGDEEKCYPYWEGNSASLLSGLNYVWTDTWEDHKSYSAEDLLDLILQARVDHNPSSIIAGHCHSGVSRIGTFMAGFTLIHEIDRQVREGKKLEDLEVSVEKIVMDLSLQRIHLVGKRGGNYITLYRLVDLYAKGLQKEQRSN